MINLSTRSISFIHRFYLGHPAFYSLLGSTRKFPRESSSRIDVFRSQLLSCRIITPPGQSISWHVTLAATDPKNWAVSFRGGLTSPTSFGPLHPWGLAFSSRFSSSFLCAFDLPVLHGSLLTLPILLPPQVSSESWPCLSIVLSQCLTLSSECAIASSILHCVPRFISLRTSSSMNISANRAWITLPFLGVHRGKPRQPTFYFPPTDPPRSLLPSVWISLSPEQLQNLFNHWRSDRLLLS